MMKKTIILLFGLIICSLLSAHPWKPNHYVIIDTDGGIDDMKAISMMLASPDVRVLGIICSPGSLSAASTYIKVKSMLNSYYHEGIPVMINRSARFKSPDMPAALGYYWGDESTVDPSGAPDFLPFIRNIIKYEPSKISFVCLGGLSTAASSVREIADLNDHLNQIIWSCEGLKDTRGFNYSIDKAASRYILEQEIPVAAVVPDEAAVFYDAGFISGIKGTGTPYAKKISTFLESETAGNHDFALQLYDDLVPLYLHYPQYFSKTGSGTKSDNSPSDITGLREGYLKIVSGETVEHNQVIKEIPEDPDFYFDDLKPYVTEIIEKYGHDEWVSGVIGNELHRHLGTFSIIGVKMGIRAREYFDTGVDEFTAVSYAGSEPPLSCMNDGVQVSTGATPGHGLLTVRSDTAKLPMVDFTYLNHTIRLRLKPELAEKISGELKEINFVYGLDSNIYWELVRKNSIKYWRELDRHEIFDIEVLN